MKTNTTIATENGLMEYMMETQAYIERLRENLIRKIVAAATEDSESTKSIDRLFNKYLSIH